MSRPALPEPTLSACDAHLDRCADALDFLVLVSPTNLWSAFAAFETGGFRQAPRFTYRPLPFDAAALRADLDAAPLEAIDDDTVRGLYLERRDELRARLHMVEVRESKAFLAASLTLFGAPSAALCALAAAILAEAPLDAACRDDGGRLDAQGFAALVEAELDAYAALRPDLPRRIELRDDIAAGVLVSRGRVMIDRALRVSPRRARALLQHEVGTHLVGWFNGSQQPLGQLRSGLTGYEALQEGLAVLSEYLVDGLTVPRLRILAGRVVGAAAMLEGASFVETFAVLREQQGFEARRAFAVTARLYRGGGLTKDACYLRGLTEVLELLGQGVELEALYVGRFARHHVALIGELRARGLVRGCALRPRFLDDAAAMARLEALRGGLGLAEITRDEVAR